jgi:hypothetical protein
MLLAHGGVLYVGTPEGATVIRSMDENRLGAQIGLQFQGSRV